jgi:pimeloyl-ACP methyl ester carboxylesterase
MYFIHGWPDNGAEWANLFAEFCSDYYCVSPTMTNFHPDIPFETDISKLGLGAQVDKHAAVARELGLTNITLVAHDWGSVFGYIFAAKYPMLIKTIVQFDIGGMVESFHTPWISLYQHQIIKGWDEKSNLPLVEFALGVPNKDMLYWQATWPYVSIWADGNNTESWKTEAYPNVQPGDWTGNWSFSPKPLSQPILFFWGDCNTRDCAGPPRTDLFFTDAWIQELKKSANDHVMEVHTNHWIYVYNTTGTLPSVVAAMKDWLAQQL